jgi:hypothetical protein
MMIALQEPFHPWETSHASCLNGPFLAPRTHAKVFSIVRTKHLPPKSRFLLSRHESKLFTMPSHGALPSYLLGRFGILQPQRLDGLNLNGTWGKIPKAKTVFCPDLSLIQGKKDKGSLGIAICLEPLTGKQTATANLVRWQQGSSGQK